MASLLRRAWGQPMGRARSASSAHSDGQRRPRFDCVTGRDRAHIPWAGIGRCRVTVTAVSTRGHRSAWAVGARSADARRWILIGAPLIALLAVVVVCLPALSNVVGAHDHGAHPAGTLHNNHGHGDGHGHTHGEPVTPAEYLGVGLAARQLVADHPHVGALRGVVHPGIDGVVTAVRSMNPLRVIAALAAIAIAVVMVAAGAWFRMRGPPISIRWSGPVRPGRIVICDLCVIRR